MIKRMKTVSEHVYKLHWQVFVLKSGIPTKSPLLQAYSAVFTVMFQELMCLFNSIVKIE